MTKPQTDEARFPLPLQILHWLLVVLVIGQLTFVLCIQHLQSYEFAAAVLSWHRAVGFLVLVLISLRIMAAAWYRPPALPAKTPKPQIWAARIVHFALITTLLAQPIIGIFMAGARGDAVSVLGLFELPTPVGYDPELADTLYVTHSFLAYALMGLVLVHLAAVAFHAIVQGRNITLRMVPQGKADVFKKPRPLMEPNCCGGRLSLSLDDLRWTVRRVESLGDERVQ